MPLVLPYSVIVLVILMGAQLWRPHLLFRFAKIGYWISVFFLIFISAYLTFQQYQIWLVSPVAQLLLPPHQSSGYFFQYSLTHFWMNLMIAFAISLLALVATKLLNKRFQERFFLPEEPWMFGTGVLLSGHPAWMAYVVTLIIVVLLTSVFQFLIFKRSERVSFYWLWLPVAILVILSAWFKFPLSS